MAAHRYWRVRVTATNGDSFARIGELQMRTGTGGPDLCKWGTIIFSTQFSSSGDNSASAAFDGNAATAWAGAITASIGYDFGAASPRDIQEVAITARNDGFGPNGAPNTFDVQWSDDNASWTTYYSVAGSNAWTAGLTRTFTKAGAPAYVWPSGGHRYWRVRATANNGDSNVRIGELRFRDVVGGPEIMFAGTVIFSSGAGSGDNTASAAFDATSATAWAATPMPAWIGYDFGASSAPAIIEAEITARNDSFGPGGAPKDFTLQYSDDNATWTTAFTITNSTGWTAGLVRSFVAPDPGSTLNALIALPLGLSADLIAGTALNALLALPLGKAIVFEGQRLLDAPALAVPLGVAATMVTGRVLDALLALRIGLLAAMDSPPHWRETDLGPDVLTPGGILDFDFARGPEAGKVLDTQYANVSQTLVRNTGDPTRPDALTVTWALYVVCSNSPGWSSQPGTGFQDPTLLYFDKPIRRVRVHWNEFTFFGNMLIAYDRYGQEIARQVIDGPWYGVHNANNDLDVGANLIWSIELVAGADWVTWSQLVLGLDVGAKLSEWTVTDEAPDNAWATTDLAPATAWSNTDG